MNEACAVRRFERLGHFDGEGVRLGCVDAVRSHENAGIQGARATMTSDIKALRGAKRARCVRCGRYPSRARGCAAGTCEASPTAPVRTGEAMRLVRARGATLPPSPPATPAPLPSHGSAPHGESERGLTPTHGERVPPTCEGESAPHAHEGDACAPRVSESMGERAPHVREQGAPSPHHDASASTGVPPTCVDDSERPTLARQNAAEFSESTPVSVRSHDAPNTAESLACEGGIPPLKGARSRFFGVGGRPSSLKFPTNFSPNLDPLFDETASDLEQDPSALAELDALLSADDDFYDVIDVEASPGDCGVLVECSSGAERGALLIELEREGWVAHKFEEWVQNEHGTTQTPSAPDSPQAGENLGDHEASLAKEYAFTPMYDSDGKLCGGSMPTQGTEFRAGPAAVGWRGLCRGCEKPLLETNLRMADGCSCNSPRGVNHGLVPTNVCTCDVCDPAKTGSTRRSARSHCTARVDCRCNECSYPGNRSA